MVFWLCMLFMLTLTPLLMIGFGYHMKKCPPKKINNIYGYRTTMSMKNQDTWDFAQIYCGKVWVKWGLTMLPLSALLMLAVWGKGEDIVGIFVGGLSVLQLTVMLLSVAATERALHRYFDKAGKRKEDAPPSFDI